MKSIIKPLSEQEQRIYNYLLIRGEATAREIIQFTNYPSSKVRDLREKGIDIETVPTDKNWDIYVLKDRQLSLI